MPTVIIDLINSLVLQCDQNVGVTGSVTVFLAIEAHFF